MMDIHLSGPQLLGLLCALAAILSVVFLAVIGRLNDTGDGNNED